MKLGDVLSVIGLIIIISALLFALTKQIQAMKKIALETITGSVNAKKLMQHRLMTMSLAGMTIFYVLNILTGFVEGNVILGNATAIGAFICFGVYVFAKFRMGRGEII